MRIPREFELDAQEAILRQEGDRLVIEPVRRRGLLATLPVLEDELFGDVDDSLQPLDDIDL